MPSSTQPEQRRQGQCKWFNTKAGFGFISFIDGEGQGGSDTFVHHSELKTSEDQFRYLVQGEYVECKLGESDDGRPTARDVTGINRGTLMCEVRHERTKESENNGDSARHRRHRGGGPRQDQASGHVPGISESLENI